MSDPVTLTRLEAAAIMMRLENGAKSLDYGAEANSPNAILAAQLRESADLLLVKLEPRFENATPSVN